MTHVYQCPACGHRVELHRPAVAALVCSQCNRLDRPESELQLMTPPTYVDLLEAAVEGLELRNRYLEDEVNALRIELDEAEDHLRDADDEIADLRQEIGGLVAEVDSLNWELEQLEDQLAEAA